VLVAAEESDVGMDPLQSHHLVKHAHIARGVGIFEIKETERGDTILQGDVDDVLFGDEDARVVDVERRRAGHETSAEDPDHDGGVFGSRTRRYHADVETVFAQLRIGVPHGGTGEVVEIRVQRLPARVGQFAGVQRLLPRIHRLRVTEAQVAQWWLRVRDAVPLVHLFSAGRGGRLA